jgi:hypothetical protein
MEPVPKAEFSLVTRASSSAWIPELIAPAGHEFTETYIDFFASTLPRTVTGILGWLAGSFLIGAELTASNSRPVRPFHVAAWIEDFPGSKPTNNQKLATVPML